MISHRFIWVHSHGTKSRQDSRSALRHASELQCCAQGIDASHTRRGEGISQGSQEGCDDHFLTRLKWLQNREYYEHNMLLNKEMYLTTYSSISSYRHDIRCHDYNFAIPWSNTNFPKPNTNFLKYSLEYNTAVEWNSQPIVIRNSSCLKIFKNGLSVAFVFRPAYCKSCFLCHGAWRNI